MDYFSGEHTAGPSNYPHPHAEEVDSATPPSSPSERGENHRSNRHTPTARTYAQLLGRTTDGHHSHSKSTHRSRSKYSESRSHSHRSDHRSDHHYNDPSSSSTSSSLKSKAKVQKLNSLLLLTSEKLTAEVARSRTAEERLTSALTLLTKCRTEQVQVTSQVSTLSTQLELYKAQLARAQDEILRAQRIVDEVEKGKKDAEEAAARARARARKLEEESVVRQAMEQGRREGYRQGLRQGQQLALERLSTRPRNEAYEDEEDEEDDYDETPTSADSKSDRSLSSAPKRSKYNDPVHIPILAEPVPLRVPSSRATSIAPSVTRRAPSYSRPILVDSKSPESIQPLDPRASSSRRTPISSSAPPQHASSSKQRDQQPIQPQPPRDTAPSISRRNTVIPPDGFIPVLGSDSMINLPAPYELSQTPKTMAASIKDGKEDTENSDKDGAISGPAGRMRSGSRSTVRTTQEQRSDVNLTQRQPTPIYAVPRPATTMSSASISQFDILSPPNSADKERFPINGPSGQGRPTDQAGARDAYDRRREEYGRRTPQTPTPAPRKAPFPPYPADRRGVVRTPSQEITEEWRSANSSASKGKSRADPPALAPPDADPYLSGLRSPPRGPRRPKRIVMPQPLSLGSAAGIMQQQHAPPPPPPPPPILYQDKPQQSKIPFPRQSPENQGHPHRPSPLEWLQKRLTNRTASNSTVPQISVEPPSHSPSGHSQDGDEIDIDPVLLTPDNAGHHALPPSYDAHNNRDAASHSSPVILLPSDELPPGFVVTSMTPKSGQQALPPSNTTYDKTKIYADAEPHTRPSTSATTLTGGTQHKSEDSLGKNGLLASPASLSRPFSIFSDGS